MSPVLYKFIGATVIFCAAGYGGTVPLGLISFDVLTQGSSNAPGVDAFDIFNFTGDPASGGFALPPDFPVITPVSFAISSLVLQSLGGMQTIPLGDIAPGQLSPPPDLQFPEATAFSSATLSATLGSTNLTLSDGTTFTALPNIQAVILPSLGTSLVAGTDFALISAIEAPTVNTPEPTYTELVFVTLLVSVVGFPFRARKRVGLQ